MTKLVLYTVEKQAGTKGTLLSKLVFTQWDAKYFATTSVFFSFLPCAHS